MTTTISGYEVLTHIEEQVSDVLKKTRSSPRDCCSGSNGGFRRYF